MGNTENTILANVMREYKDEDDEMVKNIVKKEKTITFTFDVIDEEVPVTVKILGNDQYEYSYQKVKETVRDPNFEDVLKLIMDDLYALRNKNIEYYSQMESPSADASSMGAQVFEVDPNEESEEESEGEEIEVEVDTPSLLKETSDFFTDSGEGSTMTMKLLREKPYETKTPKDLITMQSSSIKKVSETLFVPHAGSKIILRAYRWDVERIMNTFLISGKSRVLEDVGLKSTSKFMKKHKAVEKEEEEEHNDSDEFECPSCYDDMPYQKTLRLDSCGHRFCNDCWEEHLTIKIKDGLSKQILCMGSDCPCVIDENVVSGFIKDPEVKKRYDTKVLESFVEDNNQMKWCQSAPFCGTGIYCRLDRNTPLEIHCPCGTKPFCFACLEEAHNPCSCKMLLEWAKKCSDDSETLNWIKLHTRVCPKCGKATEKNGGCNHISCKCGAHWCWACGGNFTSSTVYSHKCNRYLESGGKGEGSGGRASLERYLHYFNHYNKHMTSINNQQKLQLKMNHKILKMLRRRNISNDEAKLDTLNIEWLRNALKVLFDTRRALMFSYVFAFYLFDRGDVPGATGNKETYEVNHFLRGCRRFESERERISAKNLFEDTQEQLELTTEGLNKHLDLPLEEILKEHIKMDVVLKTTLNEKRVHGLFDVIRGDMVIEGIYRLPEPRYVVTQPSNIHSGLASLGFKPSGQSREVLRKKKEEERRSKCSFRRTGKEYEKQKFYRCKTCKLVDSNNSGVCEACLYICHQGHDISYVGFVNCYCDCGAGDAPKKCRCL